MTVEDGNGAAQPKAVLSFDPVSGTFSMQFRIKVENEAEIQGGVADTKYENLRIAFGNGTITSTSNEAFCIRSNGTNFTYNVSGSRRNGYHGCICERSAAVAECTKQGGFFGDR